MLSRIARTAGVRVARAAFPRLGAAPSPVLRSATSPWIRGMARDDRPKSRGSRSNDKSQPSPQAWSQRGPQAQAASQPAAANPPSQKQPERRAESEQDGVSKDTSDDRPISFDSLPDLTQGIPSTLEYETAGATNRSSLTAVSEEEASAGGRGKGELPASAYISSTERRRQRMFRWMFGGLIGLAVGSVVYLGRNWEEDEEARYPDAPNGWGITLWWNRSSTRMREWTTYYQEPAFEKLLPDPDPSFERPYTLCISLEDMLVHSEWTREHGWRIAKRPGVDYFVRYLSQYYELVLFTTVPFTFGEPIMRKLDPYRIIMWPLFREATKYKDGEIVKDLSYLNRDLSKVIILDTDPKHVSAQPENAIVLPKWTGDPQDNELVALIPFLEYIHTMKYGDVRKVLKSFDGKHIPTEFARRESIARAEFEKQLAQQGSGKKKAPSGLGFLGSALGLKPSSVNMMAMPDEPNSSEAFSQGKMLQDIARERGQKNYEFLEKAIRENGESWLKEEAAALEKANKEAMNSVMSGFSGWFVSPPPASEGTTSASSSAKKD